MGKPFRATGVASTLLGLSALPTDVTLVENALSAAAKRSRISSTYKTGTVVAFGTLSAVARKVSDTTASVTVNVT